MTQSQDTSKPQLLNEAALAKEALKLKLSGKMPSRKEMEAAFQEAAEEVAKEMGLLDESGSPPPPPKKKGSSTEAKNPPTGS